MAKEGYPILNTLFLTALLLIFLFYFTGVKIFLGSGITAVFISGFVAFFFRDPTRKIPTGPGLIVSPADGRVVAVQEEECDYLGGDAIRISIFLSIFDVHINRAPATARIARIDYLKGRFWGAWKNKASTQNEQTCIDMDCGEYKIRVRQIAGFIARRIVCRLQESQSVSRGERFGLIKFGSRTDIIIPKSSKLCVTLNDKVKGASTILALLPPKTENKT
ncbi:MAG: phosphatidylserine decarboxylase family protein [Fibrobacterota bacterium]